FLRVVQDDRRRIQLNRTVRENLRVVPTTAVGVLDRHHVVGGVLAEARILQNRFALGIGRRICRGRNREFEGTAAHPPIVYPPANGFLPYDPVWSPLAFTAS